MTWLLDGNVLIAMSLNGHPHHRRVHNWLATVKNEKFATCPATEETLLRIHMQQARDKTTGAAWKVLSDLRAHPKHTFWPENFSYTEIGSTRLTSHNQITDAWLAELAKRRGGKLATLDEPLSALWPDSTQLIPW
jgi:hypothetical protein